MHLHAVTIGPRAQPRHAPAAFAPEMEIETHANVWERRYRTCGPGIPQAKLAANSRGNGRATTASTPVCAKIPSALVRHELAEHRWAWNISSGSMSNVSAMDFPPFSRAVSCAHDKKEPMAPMHAIEHAERARGALKHPRSNVSSALKICATKHPRLEHAACLERCTPVVVLIQGHNLCSG